MYRRGKLEYSVDTKSPLTLSRLLVFGDYVCAASDETIYVYRFSSPDKSSPPEYYTSIDLPPGIGEIIDIIHPHTYLNKIVVATSSYIILLNVRTGKLVFQSVPFESLLTAVDVAPVLDTIGLAFEDGRIQAFNLRHARVLFEISCRQQVSSISFRTDGTAHLAAGTVDGDIYFYDLNRERRVHIMREVHSNAQGGVSCVSFLNGQPVFVTSGGDNFLKVRSFKSFNLTRFNLTLSHRNMFSTLNSVLLRFRLRLHHDTCDLVEVTRSHRPISFLPKNQDISYSPRQWIALYGYFPFVKMRRVMNFLNAKRILLGLAGKPD